MPTYTTAAQLQKQEARLTPGLATADLEEYLDRAEAWITEIYRRRGLSPADTGCAGVFLQRAVYKMAAYMLASDKYLGDLAPEEMDRIKAEAEYWADLAITDCARAIDTDTDTPTGGPRGDYDEVDADDEMWPEDS